MNYRTTYDQALRTMEVRSWQEIKADDDTRKEEEPTVPTVSGDEKETGTAYEEVVKDEQGTTEPENGDICAEE